VKHVRTVPRTIEWSVACFLGIPAFWTAVCVFGGPDMLIRRDWRSYTVLWLIFGVLALAVARGWNWVRWIFVAYAALGVVAWLTATSGIRIVRTSPIACDVGMLAVMILGAGLCFVPASNRYFRRPKEPPEPTPPALSPSTGSGP